MYTSQHGGLMSGSASLSASRSRCLAGAMSSVWNAPSHLIRATCLHPSATRAAARSLSTAAAEPAHTKPSGKRQYATWHTSAWSTLASSQSCSTARRGRPATDSIRCGAPAAAASCMASARALTSLNPVAKSKTPAKVSAAYSPSDRPAAARTFRTLPGLLASSLRMPAMAAMYIVGWQSLVSVSHVGMASLPLKNSWARLTPSPCRMSNPNE
mmetsp:Transcript_53908/g.151923  ORF Transcript_53908/g.151923 Transcript_53908/m.151923 type:complete len:213 (+) Transcript_53908:395-1033(+)